MAALPGSPLLPAPPVTLEGAVTNRGPSTTAVQGTRRFEPSRQKIFTHDGPGPFGQPDPPDMTRLQKVQDGFALKIARVVGVPAYYFTQTSGDVPSGEALRVLSVRRSGRIKAWQRDAGPVWRGVKQLLGMGDEPVQWADPMPLDPSERMQMALDMKALGVALEDILRFLEFADADEMAQRGKASAAGMAKAFMEAPPPPSTEGVTRGVNDTVIALVERYKRELAGVSVERQQRLVEAWLRAWDVISVDLNATITQMMAEAETGIPAVSRARRARDQRRALALVSGQFTALSRAVTEGVRLDVTRAVVMAGTHQRHLAATSATCSASRRRPSAWTWRWCTAATR